MEELLEALASSNLPTIISVSGIALLFLSLAGRFGTYIEIKSERQKAAAIFGSILLIAGVALHVYPESGTPEGAEDGPRWIIAGSYSTATQAKQVQESLDEAGIDTLLVESGDYQHLCPGWHVVMVLTPDLASMEAKLADIKRVVPNAYPRNPRTFSRASC